MFNLLCVIDDRRVFQRNCTDHDDFVWYARTEREGLALVQALIESQVECDLYVDHDLGFDPTTGEFGDTKSIVRALEEAAFNGTPANVNPIYIHTANPSVRQSMLLGLSGYYNTIAIDANSVFTDMDFA